MLLLDLAAAGSWNGRPGETCCSLQNQWFAYLLDGLGLQAALCNCLDVCVHQGIQALLLTHWLAFSCYPFETRSEIYDPVEHANNLESYSPVYATPPGMPCPPTMSCPLPSPLP